MIFIAIWQRSKKFKSFSPGSRIERKTRGIFIQTIRAGIGQVGHRMNGTKLVLVVVHEANRARGKLFSAFNNSFVVLFRSHRRSNFCFTFVRQRSLSNLLPEPVPSRLGGAVTLSKLKLIETHFWCHSKFHLIGSSLAGKRQCPAVKIKAKSDNWYRAIGFSPANWNGSSDWRGTREVLAHANEAGRHRRPSLSVGVSNETRWVDRSCGQAANCVEYLGEKKRKTRKSGSGIPLYSGHIQRQKV